MEKTVSASDSGRDDIGPRLRQLRGQHRYSIRKLAGIAGVSPSLISGIERGRVEPSISVLKRLAAALETTLVYFFSDGQARQGRVVRSGERRRLGSPRGGGGDVLGSGGARGIVFELLSTDDLRAMEPVYGRYEVGASMGDDPVTHEGEEWGIVLRGRLKVWLANEIYFLDPGDSIWFPSTIPHRLANVADEVTEYIWVNSPKSF